MSDSRNFKHRGYSLLGELSGGVREIVSWRSTLRPLILLRGLLRKAWTIGISTKEYLIMYDILSSQFRSWDSNTIGRVVVCMFFLSSTRKSILSWDHAIPPVKKKLSRILQLWGSSRTSDALMKEYQLQAFLNIPLTDESFKMKVHRTGSPLARLANRVRNPSAVGSKSGRKFRKLPPGMVVPKSSIPRSLEVEISNSLENLYRFLGVSGTTPLPIVESETPTEESFGKDETSGSENPSLFEQYLRRARS